MIRQCCTKDCPQRHVGCHAECEKYKAWKQECKKEKEYTKNQKYAVQINRNDFDAEFWMGKR